MQHSGKVVFDNAKGRFVCKTPVHKEEYAKKSETLPIQLNVFEQREPEQSGSSSGVADTSREAYNSNSVMLLRGTQKAIIFDYLQANGAAYHKQIADALDIPHHTVSARMNELKALGLVSECGVTFCHDTNKTVNLYRVVP